MPIPHKLGLDANRPIHPDGPQRGAPTPTVDPAIFADAGAAWVRLNFMLGPWSSVDDGTRHNGRTWVETFDALVDGFRARGLQVYGLVGRESVRTDLDNRLDTLFRFPDERMSAADRDAANAWVDQYATAFGRIVQHFGNRVAVFESFNEPDDWHGMQPSPELPSPNWINPLWFARMLQAVHDKVRGELGIGGEVKLVSGPLQGLIHGNGAAGYLARTYQAGQQKLRWGRDGRVFPFDGVGYHLYIVPEFNPDFAAHSREVQSTYRRYVNEMLGVIRNAEGATARKPLYISEIGWESNDDNDVDLRFQADNLRLALDILAADRDVALGIWFSTEDFAINQGQRQFYGLHRGGNVTPAGRKPAFGVYRDTIARLFPADPGAVAYTNQHVINGLFFVATQVGKAGWDLVVAAGLTDLVKARQAPYSGLAIDSLPNLTTQERALLHERLPGLTPATRGIPPTTRAIPPAAATPAAAARGARAAARDLASAEEMAARGDRAAPEIATRAASAEAAAVLRGKGMWIWQIDRLLKRIEGRPGPADLNRRLADMAAHGGLTHVLVKIADGASPFNLGPGGTDRVRPLVDALRAAGVGVWGWQFVYGFRPHADPAKVVDIPPEMQAEVAIRRIEQFGLDGFVVNAEGDFKGQPGRATRYMERLRADLPELPIGLSSYRFPSLHRTFPWAEFLAHCDLDMPQVYWFNTPPAESLRRTLDEHARLPHARPVFPTGAAYLMEGGISATPEAIDAFLTAARATFDLAGANFFQWNSALDAGRWDAIAAHDWPHSTP
jgi:hypothetical protein